MLLKQKLFGARVMMFALSAALLWGSSQPWKTSEPDRWTARDVDQLLADSPWAQPAGASFSLAEEDGPAPPAIDVPQAGMPSPRNSATDGRWDGGVGRVNRNGPPTLTVTVRWDSALPIRQAQERQRSQPEYKPAQLRGEYIITIEGLVPGGRYGRPELDSRSGDRALNMRNPEEMLEGVMRYSRLYPRGKTPLRADDAKLDNATGTLHLFFPRSEPITLADKEVTFETRFGALSILKKFRLRDMLYHGQLEL